jgi:hypothetical protein
MPMFGQNIVYLYEVTTDTDATRDASVASACLAIIDRREGPDLIVWTVAASADQGLAFRRLPWALMPRQRGVMQLEEDEYVYRDRRTGEIVSVSAESLASGRGE